MEEVYHLLVTKKCQHKCIKCCNNFYDLDALPTITSEMLRKAHTVCLTGGEPLMLPEMVITGLCEDMREQYPNIEKLYVYTSNIGYIEHWADLDAFFNIIDGINISPKNPIEWKRLSIIWGYDKFIGMYDNRLSNRLYVFEGVENTPYYKEFEMMADLYPNNMKVIGRKWSTQFNTPPNEHFVRLPIFF